MSANDNVVIYVVAFAPDFTGWHGDTARVGGFDWYTTWDQAAARLRTHLDDGETGHDYVFRSMQIPRTATMADISELLSGELHELLEVAIPPAWIP